MRHLRATIGGHGPIIDLTAWIGPAAAGAMRSAGMQPPAPRAIRGLIDTGAQRTAIDWGLVAALGLQPTGAADVQGSAAGMATFQRPTFRLDLTFGAIQGPHTPNWCPITAVGVHLVVPNVDVLVGPDMLDDCLFIYDGPRRELLLSY
jgi:hypothetical protein